MTIATRNSPTSAQFPESSHSAKSQRFVPSDTSLASENILKEPELPFTDITYGANGEVYYQNKLAIKTKDKLETITGLKGKIYEVEGKRCLFKSPDGNFFLIRKLKDHNMAVATLQIKNISSLQNPSPIETLAVRTVYDLVMQNGRHYSMLGHINREAGIITSQISSYNENDQPSQTKDKVKPIRERAVTLFLERHGQIITQTFQGEMYSHPQSINPDIYSQFLDTLANHGITLTSMERTLRENVLRQNLHIKYKASSLQLSLNQPTGVDYRTYVLRPEVEQIIINSMNKVFESKLAEWHSKSPYQRLDILINEAIFGTDKKPDTQLVSAIKTVLDEGIKIAPAKATQYFKQLSQHDEDFAIGRLLVEHGARWQSHNNDKDLIALGSYGTQLLIHMHRAEALKKIQSDNSSLQSESPSPQPTSHKTIFGRLKNFFRGK